MIEDSKDYADSGLTIRAAKVDQFKRFPEAKTRPKFLRWGGLQITTADSIQVPPTGVVRGQFISAKKELEQGYDMDVDGGFRLKSGEWVHPLRTWNDPTLEPIVEYPFRSNDGQLWIWNVYKMRYPGAQIVEEKWTENAGFWIEEISPTDRIYHCSHAKASPPDFDSLVFRISIKAPPESK